MSLFGDDPGLGPPKPRKDAPLADRMRPTTLEDLLGQETVVGEGTPLRRALDAGRLPSLVVWGPPGVGKTTLARILASVIEARFVSLSAVSAGVKDIRKVVEDARRLRRAGTRTLLFIDEIHRFNKAQQDALLPHVEEGLVTLIGATTENPSFEVNSALLSRCRVVPLQPLSGQALLEILHRALTDERGLGGELQADDEALALIADAAHGDARRALNLLELAQASGTDALDVSTVQHLIAGGRARYDKAGEEHYNVISAFIKSMRASQPDAAVYYLVRMLEAGEDPLFVARRLVVFASEDVGNADPAALGVAVAAFQATHMIGMPEARLNLSQATLYLARAPKSNEALTAYGAAAADVEAHGALQVPMHLRNAPTGLMKKLGYGRDYHYPHDEPEAARGDTYLPEELVGRRYTKGDT